MAEDERPLKRKRSAADMSITSMATETDNEVEVAADGDAVVVVNGIAGIDQPVGIRVSSYALSSSSSGFKQLLDRTPVDDTADPPTKTLNLPDDDGNTIYILCCVLHLRNEKLPARLHPTALMQYVSTAARYDCVIAAGRCASQWFDHIYHKVPDPPLYQMIEAALLLDDPIYFARFTNRWVLQMPLDQRLENISPESGGERLALEMLARQKEAVSSLKVDTEMLVDSLAEAISDDTKHYIDCEPGEEPQGDEGVEEDDREKIDCTVDKDNAVILLSALRNANIWPPSRWSNRAEEIVKKIAGFRIPPVDTKDQCHGCMSVEEKFATAVSLVQTMHRDRLWGLCLDCFKKGGMNEGDCRYEHAKPVNLSASMQARQLAAPGISVAPPASARSIQSAQPMLSGRPGMPFVNGKSPAFPVNGSRLTPNPFMDPTKFAQKANGQGNGQVPGGGGIGSGSGGS